MRRSIAGNAFIMMTSGFAVRLLGFVYRVFLSNLIGAEGMGLYQLISPVYLLVLLTLTSGISTAVSRIVSRESALKRKADATRYMWMAFLLGTVLGMIFAFIFFFFAGFISRVVLSNERARLPFMVLAPCIPIVCMATALKGFFYGMQEMMPNALAQLFEQIVRISTAFVLVSTIGGVNSGMDITYACSLAMAGTAAGEITSFIVVFFAYIMRKIKLRKSGPEISTTKITIGKRKAVAEIFRSGVPVSANRFVTTLMATIETILIPRRLGTGGMGAKESIELLGRYNGMAMPLLMLPAIFTSALSITMVPAISEALAKRDSRLVSLRASKAIRHTFSIGILFTALFLFFPDNIAEIAYKGEDIGSIIRILAYSCAFIYLNQTLSGILNGLGRQASLFKLSFLGYGIRIAAVWFLVPVYGIISYVIAVAASLIITCLIEIRITIKDTGMPVDLRNWILKPAMSVLPAIALKYVSKLPEIIGFNIIQTAAPVTAFIIGGIILIISGSVSFRIPGLKYKRKPIPTP